MDNARLVSKLVITFSGRFGEKYRLPHFPTLRPKNHKCASKPNWIYNLHYWANICHFDGNVSLCRDRVSARRVGGGEVNGSNIDREKVQGASFGRRKVWKLVLSRNRTRRRNQSESWIFRKATFWLDAFKKCGILIGCTFLSPIPGT